MENLTANQGIWQFMGDNIEFLLAAIGWFLLLAIAALTWIEFIDRAWPKIKYFWTELIWYRHLMDREVHEWEDNGD